MMTVSTIIFISIICGMYSYTTLGDKQDELSQETKEENGSDLICSPSV